MGCHANLDKIFKAAKLLRLFWSAIYFTELTAQTVYNFTRAPAMDDRNELAELEHRFEQLIQHFINLKQEVRLLRLREADLIEERAKLMHKNELARTRVEAMIARLKAMEQSS